MAAYQRSVRGLSTSLVPVLENRLDGHTRSLRLACGCGVTVHASRGRVERTRCPTGHRWDPQQQSQQQQPTQGKGER
jgi:hypothetical protein